MKILILDDEEDIASLAQMALKKINCTALLAHNVTDAKKMLDTDKDVQLIITDFNLVGEKGTDLITYASTINPNLIYIVMSGGIEEVQSLGLEKFGKIGYLQKPFTANQIREAVSTLSTK